MDRTTKILLALCVAVFIATGIVYYLKSLRTVPVSPDPQSQNAATQESAIIPVAATSTGAASGATYDDAQYARQIATIAAERFGTFSSQAPNKNIEEVMPLLSAAGKEWVERYTAQNTPSELYAGVTTKVTSSDFKEWNPGKKAVVVVRASRITTSSQGESSGNNVKQGEVSLTKEAGEWRVDSVVWAE